MSALSIISIVLAILSFAFILLIGIYTNLLREVNDTARPYSFSRFQLWAWTMVICPTFVLNWGFSELHEPALNITCLILLGIPASVSLSAGVISSVHKSVKSDGISVKNELDSNNFFADILMDDSGQFSVVRLQQLIFTAVFIVIYLSTFFLINEMEYPVFENTAFILMGISSGTYLVGKSQKK
jgi:hypothetical protein